MKSFRMLTAGLLALSMSLIPASAQIVQNNTLTVSAAETPSAEQLKEYTDIIVNQVNDVRVSNNLRELQILPVMNQFAQVRAEEIPLHFSHNRPPYDANGNLIEANIQLNDDGTLKYDESGQPVSKNCFSVIKEAGFFYNTSAENIAAGNVSPTGTFDNWMNSEKHRDNIMNPEFTHIGIGYFYDPDSELEYYWSMFLVGVYDANATPLVYDGQYIPERELGDADGSHTIDAADASMILTYTTAHSVGLPFRYTDAFFEAADLNSDGQVNAVDASILLNYIANVGADPSVKIEDFIWIPMA